jgi:2-aminoadipate transaminase
MGATMGFQSFEAEVIEVTMDADGVRLDLLDEAMNAARAKLFYTIPDYQNPTGVSLSRERRQQLVDLARDRGVLVVEDVTYRELGFYGDRLPSLWSLAPDAVVQIGTFSKTFFPGVRLGWACGPSEIIEQMIRAKQNTDQCAGSMGQRLLEEYGRSGALDRQIDRARVFYRGRRELMMQALATHMPEGVSWTEPRGGFVTWLTLPDGVDAVQVATRAMEDAIAIVPGSVFSASRRGVETTCACPTAACKMTSSTRVSDGWAWC